MFATISSWYLMISDALGGLLLVAHCVNVSCRLIVQDLVGKGATVRALVRNVYRARNLKQLQGADVRKP
jgi:hypothetical protein